MMLSTMVSVGSSFVTEAIFLWKKYQINVVYKNVKSSYMACKQLNEKQAGNMEKIVYFEAQAIKKQ